MNNVKLISLNGMARAGKDTFYAIAKNILSKNGYETTRLAYADEVKRDLDQFLLEKVGISAWTSNPKEKELIRPFIVSYSTNLMRKINPNVWIDKLNVHFKNLLEINGDNMVYIITDGRFLNEIDNVKRHGGVNIHLKKYTVSDLPAIDGSYQVGQRLYDSPPNEEEAINDPIVEKHSDLKVEWEQQNYIDGNILDNKYLNQFVLCTLNKTKYFSNTPLLQ